MARPQDPGSPADDTMATGRVDDDRPVWSVAGTVARGISVVRLDLAGGAAEALGITGDIGSGKSTTLDVLSGRCPLDHGSLTWRGQEWPAKGGPTVADVRQRPADHLPEERSGWELLSDLGLAAPIVAEALAEVGLTTTVAERPSWTYSGAEAQRVALLLAVLAEPELLLLDEPCAALDKRTRASVTAWLVAALDRRSESRRPSVVASSDPALLGSLCQRVVRLS